MQLCTVNMPDSHVRSLSAHLPNFSSPAVHKEDRLSENKQRKEDRDKPSETEGLL